MMKESKKRSFEAALDNVIAAAGDNGADYSECAVEALAAASSDYRGGCWFSRIYSPEEAKAVLSDEETVIGIGKGLMGGAKYGMAHFDWLTGSLQWDTGGATAPLIGFLKLPRGMAEEVVAG